MKIKYKYVNKPGFCDGCGHRFETINEFRFHMGAQKYKEVGEIKYHFCNNCAQEIESAFLQETRDTQPID